MGPRRNRILLLFLVATALTLGWDFYASTGWNAARLAADDFACQWTDSIRRLPSGSYEVSICVTRDKMPKIPRHPGLQPALMTKGLNHTHRLSFADMIKIPDENWKLPVDNAVFKLHEQPLAMNPLVEFVKRSGYFPEPPVNNYTIRFLNVSSVVCPRAGNRRSQTQGPEMIVVVKSGVYNFESRRQMRLLFKDMAKEGRVLRRHLSLVFSVGLPRRANDNFFQRDGFNITLPGRAGKALLDIGLHHADLTQDLQQESEMHDDMLIGDYEDTYYNLTLKMHHTFAWAAAFCRPPRGAASRQQDVPLFIFLDDDFSFNVANLIHVLRSASSVDLPERLLIGNNRRNSLTVRSHPAGPYQKWALSKREMPAPRLPAHCNGAFYILDYRSLEDIAIAMYFTATIPMDDVWLGLVMSRLSLEFSKPHPNIYNPKASADAETSIFASLDVFFKSRHDKQMLERLHVERRKVVPPPKPKPKPTVGPEQRLPVERRKVVPPPEPKPKPPVEPKRPPIERRKVVPPPEPKPKPPVEPKRPPIERRKVVPPPEPKPKPPVEPKRPPVERQKVVPPPEPKPKPPVEPERPPIERRKVVPPPEPKPKPPVEPERPPVERQKVVPPPEPKPKPPVEPERPPVERRKVVPPEPKPKPPVEPDRPPVERRKVVPPPEPKPKPPVEPERPPVERRKVVPPPEPKPKPPVEPERPPVERQKVVPPPEPKPKPPVEPKRPPVERRKVVPPEPKPKPPVEPDRPPVERRKVVPPPEPKPKPPVEPKRPPVERQKVVPPPESKPKPSVAPERPLPVERRQIIPPKPTVAPEPARGEQITGRVA